MNLKLNIKSVVILLLLLQILIIMLLLAPGITILLLSSLFFVFALLLGFKAGFYEKYLAFVNPRSYEKFSAKGSSFMKKQRILQSVAFFLLAVLNGFNGYRLIDTYEGSSLLANFKISVPYAFLAMLFFGILCFADVLAKRSDKDNCEER